MDIEFVIDGGAYCTLSPVVLSRGTIHAAGPVLLSERSDPLHAPSRPTRRRTAHSAGSARRRSVFALERQMDRGRGRGRSDAGGVPPAQFHPHRPDERGRSGDARAGRHGGAARSRVRAVGLSREARAVRRGERDGGPIKTRHRLRVFHARRRFHGIGRGASRLASSTSRRPPTATSACSTASTEIGQGTNTVFAQIACDALGIDCDDIEIAAARHRGRARQRPDGGVPHVHGRRQARGDRGARTQDDADRTSGLLADRIRRRRVPHRGSRIRGTARRRSAQRRSTSLLKASIGTTRSTGRRVRRLRLGGLRRARWPWT